MSTVCATPDPGRSPPPLPPSRTCRPRAQLGCLGNEQILLLLPACYVLHLLG